MEELGIELGRRDHSAGRTVGQQLERQERTAIERLDIGIERRSGGGEAARVVTPPVVLECVEARAHGESRQRLSRRRAEGKEQLRLAVQLGLERACNRRPVRDGAARGGRVVRVRRQRVDRRRCLLTGLQRQREHGPAPVEDERAALGIEIGRGVGTPLVELGPAADDEAQPRRGAADPPDEDGIAGRDEVGELELARAVGSHRAQDRGVLDV